MPGQLFIDCSNQLNSQGDKWAVLGIKLGLLTAADINYYEENYRENKGLVVLSLWQHSDCSYMDLVVALRDEDIHLDKLASQIESHFTAV